MKNLISTLFFSFLALLLLGQPQFPIHDSNSYCATDILQQELLDQDPDLQKKINIRESFYRDAMQSSEKMMTPPYILPVVVHIIHENGAENIPDAQVQQAIDWLNESFANTDYYDQNTGLNTEIQFCLAIQDPDGNPSDGINRVQSPLTDIVMETNQLDMKNLSRWDPLSYINIWVIREICSQGIGCGVAGFAYFPEEHGSNLDGIVLESGYMGPAEGENAVLTHEMGHYLGLYHTFQGGCPNSDCLADGDRVCDTPPDGTTARPACDVDVNSCATDEDDNSTNNPFRSLAAGGIGDQLDMRNNYMDYSPLECYNAFTAGQTDRMYWFLDNVRFSLSESVGCEDPCPLPLTVDFAPNTNEILAGQTVTFINNTINGISYEWEIDGVFESNTEDLSYTFNQEGEVSITLIATGVGGDCARQLTLIFEVKCGVESEFSVDETTLNIGDEFTLTNLSQNADAYSWYINTALVSNAENYSYTTTEAGVIEVCLTAEDDFCEDTRCRYITVLDLGDGSFNGFHKWVGDATRNVYFFIYHQGEDAFYAIGSFIDQSVRTAQISKLDKCGEALWTRNYESDAAFVSAEIAPNGDLVMVGQKGLGNSNNSVYLVRTDADGNLIWGKSLLRSGRQRAIKMKPSINDPLGETYLVEHWKSNGSTSDDMAVFKFDAAGNVLWSKDYSGSGDEQSQNIIPQTGGGVLVIGHASSISWEGLTIELDTNGDLVDSKRYSLEFGFEMRAGLQLSDGGFIFVGGYFANPGSGERKPGIVRVDADYNVVWVKAKVSPIYAGYSDLVQDIDGYLYTSSFDVLNGEIRMVIHKFDVDGNFIWARNVGGTSSSSSEGSPRVRIAGTNPDRLIVYQYEENAPLGGLDTYVAVTDTSLMTCAIEAYDVEFTSLPMTIADVSWTETLTTYTITNETEESDASVISTVDICAGNCAEICNNGIDDDFDNLVDYYDPDCPCIDTIDCGTPFYSFCESVCEEEENDDFNFDFETEWINPTTDIYDLNTTVVADIDGDCQGDIVIFSGDDDRMIVVNSVTGQEITSIDLLDFPIDVHGTPALADVDLDGMAEIFILTRGPGLINFYLTRYDFDANTGQLVQTWQNPQPFDYGDGNGRGTVPSIADFDGNGIPEVYVLNKIYNSETGLLLADGGTNSIGGNTVDGGFGAAMTTAVDVLPNDECFNCQGLELVAGNQVYSVQINDYNDASANSIEVERSAPNNLRDGVTAIADFDGDGDLDAIVVFRLNSSVHHTIYVWDLQTENLIGNVISNFPFPIGPGEPQAALPSVGDIDGDNKPEIVVLIRLRLVILEDYESGGGVNWGSSNAVVQNFTNVTENSASTSFSLFDFNQDGKQEIIHRGTQTIDIYDENLTNLASQSCLSLTAAEYVTITDADQDGSAELYCSCKDSGLHKFVSTNDSWPSTRAIWNQHNYYATNIADDGTIPIQQQQQQLVMNANGEYPLNNFLQQHVINNEPAALEISLNVQEVGCDSDSTEVIFTLCNLGQEDLVAPIYVTFYDDNPTLLAANVLQTNIINETLLSGDCQNYTQYIPRTNEWIFAIANDNGTTPTPFGINTGLPNTEQTECQYLDNLDSLFFEYVPPVLDLGPDIMTCDNGIVTLDAGTDFVDYKWQDFTSEQTYTAWEDGTYWVTVIDECGGMQSDTVVIETETITDLNLGADTTLCGGEPFVFNLTYFDNWEWTPNDFLDCDDCPTVTASPDVETTYTVVASTDAGCFSVDTVTLMINAVDVILLDTMEICPGESFDFHGTSINESGDYEIGNGENCDTLFNLFVFYSDTIMINEEASICTGESIDFFGITVTETGVYEYNSEAGCDTLFTLNAVVSDIIETDEMLEICEGESIFIFGNEESEAGDYSEEYISFSGCDSIHTITLDFFAPIEINTSATETCIGENTGTTSVNIVANGQAPFQYLWIETNSTAETQNNLSPGTYTVLVTDDNGCSVQEEVTVSEIPTPVIAFETTNVSCFGDADGSISLFTDEAIMISLDGINYSSTDIIDNLSAGEYLIYFQNETDCTFTESVNISEPAELILQLPNDTEMALGDSIVLSTQTNGTDLNYQWQPPLYLSCDTCANPVATPFESIRYLLSATDTSDCMVQEEITLFLNNQVEVYFPSAFSPNNDGVNDSFHPFAGNAVTGIKRLSIYDRWGELLFDNIAFQANVSSEGWDGTFRGKLMPVGVYVWVAELEFLDGRTENFKGDVLLLR